MNRLYLNGYRDEGPGYLSNFGQITRCVAIHGVHNEQAIDRNTSAITAQTEMQHEESDESQVQFSGHSMMLERESNETQNIMTAHTFAMQQQGKNITSAITSQTQTIDVEGDKITNAITAQTNSIQTRIQGVIEELEKIEDKNEAIKDAIAALEVVNNNYNNNYNYNN